jgi:hypothetical protein
MSQHDWYIFPTHPHLPAPDWPALSQSLIDAGILLQADGGNIAPEDLRELSSELAINGAAPWIDVDTAWRTTSEVVDAYRPTSDKVAQLSLARGLSMRDTVASMREQGFDFKFWPSLEAKASKWGGARHRLGEGAIALFDSPQEWEREQISLSISLLAFEGTPHVTAGENLCVPFKPGTTEPLTDIEPYGSHMDFIGAAYEDPAVTWTDPETGKAFFIFDLDWQQSLGLGWRFVHIEGGWNAGFLDRFSGRLAALLGQSMTVAHQHL